MQGFRDVGLAYASFVVHPGHLGDQPELPVRRDSRVAESIGHATARPRLTHVGVVSAQIRIDGSLRSNSIGT